MKTILNNKVSIRNIFLNQKTQIELIINSFNEQPGTTVYALDPSGIYLNNTIYTNEAIKKYSIPRVAFGKTIDDIFKNKIAKNFYMDFAARTMELNREVMTHKTYSANGIEYRELLYNKPLKNEAGNIIGVIGVGVDINYIKHTATRLFVTNENLKKYLHPNPNLKNLQNHLNIILKELLLLFKKVESGTINSNNNNKDSIMAIKNYLKDILHNFKDLLGSHEL